MRASCQLAPTVSRARIHASVAVCLKSSGYFLRKKAEFLWSTYIHGISTYVHTYFLVSSPKGLFRNNHYLQSLHLITKLTLLLITMLNFLLITILNLAKKHLQNYLKVCSLRQ